jgi:hypothetical protein
MTQSIIQWAALLLRPLSSAFQKFTFLPNDLPPRCRKESTPQHQVPLPPAKELFYLLSRAQGPSGPAGWQVHLTASFSPGNQGHFIIICMC